MSNSRMMLRLAGIIPPELLDEYAKRNPKLALEFAAECITAKRLDWCAKQAPWDALTFASHLITPERLAWCKGRHQKGYPSDRRKDKPLGGADL